MLTLPLTAVNVAHATDANRYTSTTR